MLRCSRALRQSVVKFRSIYSAVRLNLSNSEDATGLWSKASICQNPSNFRPRSGPYYPPLARIVKRIFDRKLHSTRELSTVVCPSYQGLYYRVVRVVLYHISTGHRKRYRSKQIDGATAGNNLQYTQSTLPKGDARMSHHALRSESLCCVFHTRHDAP